MDSNSTSLLGILIWIFIGIVSMVSLLGNGFITVVLGHQWLQNRKMLPCDFLLMSLSTSRFVTQLLSSVNYPLCVIISSRKAVLYISWIFFNMASLCSTTWLSVFYCVKVTNFANCLFLWLKPRISKLVPRLLAMSIIISSILFLPSVIESLGDKKWSNVTGTLQGSANQSDFYNKVYFAFFPMQFTLTFINFSISIIASSLLLFSLWKHTRNLKKSSAGDKDVSIQVHINVITPMLFYVFFYLLYFGSAIIFAGYASKSGSPENLAVGLMASVFPSAHSIILILTNPKLKKMAARILNIRQRAA